MANAFTADEGDRLPGYRAEVVRALEIATAVTVYDGEVPDEVDEDSNGFILPYVVLFSGDGDAIPEVDLSNRRDMDGLRWEFQTTSVGATPDVAARVAGVVRRALTNRPMGTYHILPAEEFGIRAPVKDTTINPVRFFLPRQWRLDTT